MKKFVSWLGGIAATVIAGWLVYKLTVPPTPPPQPTPITFEGMVIDGERNIPIKNARITFHMDGVTTDDDHDLTDVNGSYRVQLPGLSSTSSVLLSVHAIGYRDESKQFTSLMEDNRYDPIMTALPPPPTPTPPHGATPAPTPAPTVRVPIPPQYIQRLSIKTIKVLPKK
jgi:hypothetical protein